MENNFKHLLNGSLAQYNDNVVPKIPVFAGNDITSEVYYFKPGQVLKLHRHPSGEQIFFFLKGSGKMKLGEKELEVTVGSTVFIPTGEWHEITNNNDEEMVAVQVTKVGAGAEFKDV
ncbi:cupin [Clostridium polyendosporum]|uniref:Cupin n=1 Tax=Clostridium polyendosporum TaxID=69208 RepID=A0A919S0G2_9CLOT|nr:cupin domain-containing protein [Clostridium polyendosporum]GIM29149.1 cupin [Clostridium polyendosporum]